MPKSRQRKNHKKKVKNYLNQKRAAENKARQILMEQYKNQQEKMAEQEQVNAQKAGDNIENTNIEVDLDIDQMGEDEYDINEDVAVDIDLDEEVDDTKN